MIAVDTSAIVAILLRETDAAAMAQAIEASSAVCMSAGSLIELHRVAKGKKGRPGRAQLDAILREAGLEIITVTPKQAEIAIEATWKFPILNYGDVFAYALAKERGIPLLFKSDDFSQTDIKAAF